MRFIIGYVIVVNYLYIAHFEVSTYDKHTTGNYDLEILVGVTSVTGSFATKPVRHIITLDVSPHRKLT